MFCFTVRFKKLRCTCSALDYIRFGNSFGGRYVVGFTIFLSKKFIHPPLNDPFNLGHEDCNGNQFACHACDLNYVFHSYSFDNRINITSNERELAVNMQRIWGQFTKDEEVWVANGCIVYLKSFPPSTVILAHIRKRDKEFSVLCRPSTAAGFVLANGLLRSSRVISHSACCFVETKTRMNKTFQWYLRRRRVCSCIDSMERIFFFGFACTVINCLLQNTTHQSCTLWNV
jgi:hypothetical protein